jgi:hypothetical protein
MDDKHFKLNFFDREKIQKLLDYDRSIMSISLELNKSYETIYEELQKYRINGIYSAKKADSLSQIDANEEHSKNIEDKQESNHMNWISVENELPKEKARFLAKCQNDQWTGIVDVFFDPHTGWKRCEDPSDSIYVLEYAIHPFPNSIFSYINYRD